MQCPPLALARRLGRNWAWSCPQSAAARYCRSPLQMPSMLLHSACRALLTRGGVQSTVVVHVGVAQRTAGDRVAADTDRGHRANLQVSRGGFRH